MDTTMSQTPGNGIKKIVFVDLDGTIIDYTGQPFPGVPEAIGKLKSRGVDVILATGRMLGSAVRHVRKLGLSSPVIAYNGALVADVETGKWLLHQSLASSLAADIIAAATGEEATVMCFINDRYLTNKMDDKVKAYEERSQVSALVIPDLHRAVDAPPSKVLVVCGTRKQFERVRSVLQNGFGTSIHMAESRTGYLEVLARGVTKASAALWVCSLLKIDIESAAAFGDNMNDLELLSSVGFAGAMESAPAALKEAAQMTVSSPERGGLAEALLSLLQSKV